MRLRIDGQPYIRLSNLAQQWIDLRQALDLVLAHPPEFKLMPEINEIHEVERLESILEVMKTAASPEELRRVWAP